VAAAAAAAAAVCHSCACIGTPCLRHCVHGASIGGAEEGGGLELAVLTRLPTLVVGAGGGALCGACAEPLREGQVARQLPCGCLHHQRCVDRVLTRAPGLCPVREAFPFLCGPVLAEIYLMPRLFLSRS
jgi:hypothetical protein